MNTTKLLSALTLSCVVIACSKDKSTSLNDPSFSASSFSELNVSKDFNWSSSVKGNFTVVLDAPSDLHTENQSIELQDADGNILQIAEVRGGQASFNIVVPQAYDGLFAYYPNTQDRVKINKSTTNLKIEEFDFVSGANNPIAKSGLNIKKSTTTGSNLLVDGDFENASPQLDSRAHTKVRPAGAWYNYNTAAHIATKNGSKVFTSKEAAKTGEIIQAVNVAGDGIYELSYEFSGNAGFRILFMDQNQKYIGHTKTISSSNGVAYCKFFASPNVRHIQLYGSAGDNEFLDNIDMTQVADVDTDGDGVVDRKDYYPNDPSKSYSTFFPTIGRQIIAFEDLWPYNGDNDFNDVVLSNYVEYSWDKDLNLKSATVHVKVEAMGAGVASGVGLQLLGSNKTPLASNIISSISLQSGNTVSKLDPNVLNGVIVAENLMQAVKPYYSNTGSGPKGTPQEFVFTIEFAANTGNIAITPDFYIFRSGERGKEIHLPGFYGTEAANTSLYNTGNDVNGTYKNSKGLPWAIEVIYPYTLYFNHPLEKHDIVQAYTQFTSWASSNGLNNKNWMLYPTEGKVYKP